MTRGRRKGALDGLTQREQEAMDLIYKDQPCTAIYIQKHMTGNLTNATVRTILRTLETKKYLSHTTKSQQFFYRAILNKKTAAKDSLRKLLNTFFAGSITDAVATYIDEDSLDVNSDELEELAALIEASKLKRNKP